MQQWSWTSYYCSQRRCMRAPHEREGRAFGVWDANRCCCWRRRRVAFSSSGPCLNLDPPQSPHTHHTHRATHYHELQQPPHVSWRAPLPVRGGPCSFFLPAWSLSLPRDVDMRLLAPATSVYELAIQAHSRTHPSIHPPLYHTALERPGRTRGRGLPFPACLPACISTSSYPS